MSCPNRAGFVKDDFCSFHRKDWGDRYGKGVKFKFSDKSDDFTVNSRILTETAVVGWAVCFADLPEGESYFARLAFNCNMENTVLELDRLDKEYGRNMAHPTHAFRTWLDNEFQCPSALNELFRLKKDEFSKIEDCRLKIIQSRIKSEVHSIQCPKEQRLVHRKIVKEVDMDSIGELEQLTVHFRENYGGSREHGCLYCHLNFPCFICGENYPIQKFVSNDLDGNFSTTTKSGKPYSGRWDSGCGSVFVRQSGLHCCLACHTKTSKFRERTINLVRDKRLNFETEQKKGLTDKKSLKKLEKLKIKMEKKELAGPFPEIFVKAGPFAGEKLQFRVLQGGIPMEKQKKGCLLPRECQMVWKQEAGGEEIVASYIAGEEGNKKDNGCSKANRARISKEIAEKKEIARLLREKEEKEESDRLLAREEVDARQTAKRMWVEREVQKMDHLWLEQARERFTYVHTLADEENGELNTEYDREAPRWIHAQRSRLFERLFKKVDRFHNIGDYIAKAAEESADIDKYGRIIDLAVLARLQESEAASLEEEEENPAGDFETVLDKTILAQKRKMEEVRAEYMKTNAKKKRKMN